MRSDRLRVVSGNAFATLVVVRAYAADGSELGGWSLGDSEDVSVTAVSRYGRRVMEHEIVADTALRVNCIRVEWPADMAVCEWGLEITGTHDGRVWRSMEPGVVTIVRTNPEACIPESSIIASDYYRVVQELRVVGSGGVQSDWEETNPDVGGYIRNKPALAEVATSGAYDDLSGKPVVPTRVGQLTNDAGYVTSSTLSGYATKSEMTEAEVAIGQLSDKVDGFDESIEGLEESVASLDSSKADVNHTHPHTSITDWDAATASFLTTTTAASTYLTKTDAAATYATKASVPTKTSDLTNDSGYITTASLSGYATQEEVENAKLESIKNSLPTFNGTNDLSTYEVIDGYPDDSIYGTALVDFDISTDQFVLVDYDNKRCYTKWKAFGLYSSWENYKTYYEDDGEYYANEKLYYSDGGGMMYCWDSNSFFSIHPKVENVSELTNDRGFVNTSGVNSIINSRMEVISRSAYNALTPTQQASKIYFIYEDSNSSAS